MITRYTVNGDLAALKTAIEAVGIFSTVVLDDDTTPTKVICKDASENVLFEAAKSGSSRGYTAYCSAGSSASVTGSTGESDVVYAYKVGTSCVLQIGATNKQLLVIGKTNKNGIGIVLPTALSGGNAQYNIRMMCWNDQPVSSTSSLIFGTSSSMNTINHTLFVEIPMNGSYTQALYLPNAFFMPMVQEGMRGAIQQLEIDGEVRLTNGWLAVRDDVGGAA